MTVDERAEHLLRERADGWVQRPTASFRKMAHDMAITIRHAENTKEAEDYLLRKMQDILKGEVDACAGHIKLVREGII